MRAYLLRNRIVIQDLSLILAFIAVAGYLAFEVDIFMTEGAVTPQGRTIELDEALLLGGLLAVCLLIFSMRRHHAQKRETRRRIAAERKARELAYQDPLTGLPNRRQFDDALRTALAAPPAASEVHAVLMLDLNGFKRVNDTHGHGTGDEVLIVAGQRLLASVRDGDLAARLGGDEFAVLARHLNGAEAATSIALRILQAFEEPITIGTTQHRIGTGIGIALLPIDADTLQEAQRKADVALYRAKAERRPALRFFEEEMDAGVRDRARLEDALRRAVGAGEIAPRFRPTLELGSGRIVGFEVVLRWNDPEFGEVAPERFVPVAEETGLIHAIMQQALDAACRAARQWPDEVMLGIDIHPSQLKDKELPVRILGILDGNGLARHRLEVGITESAVVQDVDAARETLGALHEGGVRISLDKFGTGYSSLYHLRTFKLDKIKIDRRFISSMSQEVESASIVSALVGLGRGLGVTVGAEGVEDEAQRAALLATGCEQGQSSEGEAIRAEETVTLFRLPPSGGR